VPRLFSSIGLIVWLASSVGCASTWDTVSSKKFRDAPFKTMFSNDDPMHVLRNKVDGQDRANAMRRLKEPATQGRPQAEQDEALQFLEQAATQDPSPVVRTSAIDALGRFQDPRAIRILIDSYHLADGRPASQPAPGDDLQQASARSSPLDPLGLGAPVGFQPEFSSVIRTKAVNALAETKRPEAVTFLARVASGEFRRSAEETIEERDVRTAAVRGLGQIRNKESVVVLAKVLKSDSGRDVVISSRAHEGLVNLTGQRVPPDPEKWNAIVQSGFEVVPEPNALQRAVHTILP
jgi:HEAT repeat protein